MDEMNCALGSFKMKGAMEDFRSGAVHLPPTRFGTDDQMHNDWGGTCIVHLPQPELIKYFGIPELIIIRSLIKCNCYTQATSHIFTTHNQYNMSLTPTIVLLQWVKHAKQ